MNRVSRKVLRTIAAMVFAVAAMGDTLTLRDGDQLTGSLIEVSDDVVEFRTELAGKMMLPLTQVVSMVTARDVHCVFKDGSRATGRLAASESGMRFIPVDGRSGYAVTPDMLATVAPRLNESLTPTAVDSPLKKTVSTALEGGARFHSGNDDYVALYSRLQLENLNESYYFQTDLYLETGETGQFPDVARASASWRLRPDASVSPVVMIGAERDTDETLDLRATLGLGGYRSFWNSQFQQLDSTIGINFETEKWDADSMRGFAVFPESGLDRLEADFYYRMTGTHRDDADIRLNLNLRHWLRLFRSSSWEESLSLYPSLTDIGDWRGTYESSLLFPLTDRLRLNLNLRIDYDSDPAFRYLKEWRTAVGAGIQWNF